MKVTLDTNVLVRLATQDDPAQAALALSVLQKSSLIAVPTPALCEMVWVLLRGYRYTPAQVAHALRTLLQVRQVVCHTPTVLAGLALLENGGDFADGVIAFEGDLLGGTEFVSFDQQAVKLLKAQKHKVRLLKLGKKGTLKGQCAGEANATSSRFLIAPRIALNRPLQDHAIQLVLVA